MTEEGVAAAGDEDDTWVELTPDLVLPARAGVLENGLAAPIDRRDLLGLLVTDVELGIRVTGADRSEPSAPWEQMVGHTRLFIDRTRLTDLQWDASTFAAVWALAHSAVFSTAATLFQKTLRTVKIITEAELDMTIVLNALSRGRPYDEIVAEGDIVAQYDGDAKRALGLLHSLSKKGVAKKTSGGWHLVW